MSDQVKTLEEKDNATARKEIVETIQRDTDHKFNTLKESIKELTKKFQDENDSTVSTVRRVEV
jgi:DNA-binding winged helix-turn-helix (wHTH) protein